MGTPRTDWAAVPRDAGHRPWPLPARPWVMTMSWQDLLFAHWPLAPSAIAPRLPAGLVLDTFDGQAWLSVVPFRMADVGARWLPRLPGVSAFPELNIRTYVVADGKPGVWFFGLDAASRMAVWGARTFFHMPYFHAAIHCTPGGGDSVAYQSRRTDDRLGPGELVAHYWPTGAVFHSAPGTLDHWLTERYCLYGADRHGHLYRGDVHHARWPLQAAGADIAVNTVADAHGLGDLGPPERLHFARRLDVVAWWQVRVGPASG